MSTDPSHNREVALRLAHAGLPVFPCDHSKKPLVSWRAESTANFDQVAALWSAHPNALPAIDLDKAGLVALDGDRHGGPDGVAALTALLDKHECDLCQLPGVKTPNDGIHVYYRQNGASLSNSRGNLPDGVDIRGKGGYVIAPYAALADGRWYEPMAGTRDIISAYAANSIPYAPQWLVDLVRPKEPERPAQPTGKPSGAREEAYARAALEGVKAKVSGLPLGERNNSLYSSACHLFSMAVRGWADQVVVEHSLRAAAHACGLPPVEYNKTIASAMRKGFANPHPDLPDRNPDFKPNGAGGAPGAVPEPSEEAPPEIDATPWEWVESKDLPPREWIYNKHYIRQFVSVTVAPGGVGKSSLGLVEALAIASGKPLLGIAPVERTRVWLWNGEDPKVELDRRITAAIQFYGLTRADVEGWLYVNSGRDMQIVIAQQKRDNITISTPVVDSLKRAIRQRKIGVLIVDPFVKTHRVSENDNMAIESIVKQFADIADETRCAVELVHHSRKTASEVTVDDSRGAGALLAAARSARVCNVMTHDEVPRARVREEERRFFFKVENGKANLAPPPEGAEWYRFKPVNLGNATETRPADDVGVVTSFEWPGVFDGFTLNDTRRALSAIAVHVDPCFQSSQSENWVGKIIGAELDLDPSDRQDCERLKAIVRHWFKEGLLYEVDGHDKRRKPKRVVKVKEHPF